MEITTSTLYWILMLDNISKTIAGFAIIMGILCVVFIVFAPPMSNFEDKETRRIMKLSIIPGVLAMFFFALFALTPTTKQMATILIAPKLINSEFIQKDLPKETKELYGMAKSYLKQQITETTKESK